MPNCWSGRRPVPNPTPDFAGDKPGEGEHSCHAACPCQPGQGEWEVRSEEYEPIYTVQRGTKKGGDLETAAAIIPDYELACQIEAWMNREAGQPTEGVSDEALEAVMAHTKVERDHEYGDFICSECGWSFSGTESDEVDLSGTERIRHGLTAAAPILTREKDARIAELEADHQRLWNAHMALACDLVNGQTVEAAIREQEREAMIARIKYERPLRMDGSASSAAYHRAITDCLAAIREETE